MFSTFSRTARTCFFVLAAIIGPSACAQDPAPGQAPDLFEQGRVYALAPDRVTRGQLIAAGAQLSYVFQEETDLAGLGLILLTFDLPPGVTGPAAIAALEGAAPASTVGVNHAYRLQQSTAARRNYANAALAWTSGACRAAQPVGVIDTGINPSSPMLANARIVSRRLADGPAGPTRHGTDTAHVLADPSRLRDVTIYNADVMAEQGEIGLATGADILVRALNWLSEENVRLVNMSLAGPYNKLLDLAVSSASARGMILIAAVGNAGPGAATQFPAGFNSVIAVTAVDANDRIYRQAVRGAHVDFAAPGVDVFLPSPDGGRFVTGTSIAAPFVTARILADRDLTGLRDANVIIERLAASAKDLGSTGADDVFGRGLIQASQSCD